MSKAQQNGAGRGNPLTDGTGRLAEIRALNRHLVSAEDAKILKVVAMVDALPQRGEADTLIAPLRTRLAELRPRRPLSGPRLMFLPLDPVLVAAPRWRRGALTIPRTAVAPLLRQVEALAPGMLAQASAEVAGFSTVDHHIVRRVGSPLWARAAEALVDAPPPADWAEATGLNAADHRTLRDAVALVLHHAPTICAQFHQPEPDQEVIAHILTQAAARPDAMGVLISVLLHWLPGAAAQVLGITSAHNAPTGLPGRTATERAVEQVLETIETENEAPQDPMATLPKLRRVVAMLEELEAGSIDRPNRVARIATTRGKLEAAARKRFQTMLDSTVTGPLANGLPETPEAEARLESAARDIRRFETVARRISGSDHFDKQLRSMVATLAPRGADDNEARVERLRLAEILLGSERALQMLLEAEKA